MYYDDLEEMQKEIKRNTTYSASFPLTKPRVPSMGSSTYTREYEWANHRNIQRLGMKTYAHKLLLRNKLDRLPNRLPVVHQRNPP